MSDDELISLACETIEGYLALGNERFEACGATFIRNRATPSRYDANTIGLIRDATQIDDLIARAELEYAHLDYRQFHIDPLTPPQVEAHLCLAGYTRWSPHLVMVLQGALLASPQPVAIVRVETDEQWHTYLSLQDIGETEYFQRLGQVRPVPNDEYLAYIRAKSPPVNTWLAQVDAVACAYASSWAGDNGVGLIEELFIHPEYRRPGLAISVIAHCAADAREGGAGPVFLMADPSETHEVGMYKTLGFTPLFIARSQYQ